MLPSDRKFSDFFLGWQCRLRQHSVRKLEGRPAEGMRAGIRVGVSDRVLGPVNTVLVRADAQIWTDEFRYLVKKTHDPNDRYRAALKILASAYYQQPKEFEGALFASFALDSELAGLLLEQRQCQLQFSQFNQRFDLHCEVLDLATDSMAYQAVYWHNRLFNSTMPATIKVLRFGPQWGSSTAEPMIS